MKNSSSFFRNCACEHFPCHKVTDTQDFNCLFCYCPMYTREKCPGNPKYLEVDGKVIKVCDECMFPHIPDNYDKIIHILSNEK